MQSVFGHSLQQVSQSRVAGRMRNRNLNHTPRWQLPSRSAADCHQRVCLMRVSRRLDPQDVDRIPLNGLDGIQRSHKVLIARRTRC